MFGNRLKELRNEFEFTQKEMADKLNVSASTIGMYERDKRDPDTTILKEMAKIFNVSTDYLLGHSDYKQDPSVSSAYSINTDGLNDEDIEYVKGLVERLKEKHSK